MQVQYRTGLLSVLAGLAITVAACSSSSKTSTGPTTTKPETSSSSPASSTPASSAAGTTVKIATNAKLGQVLVNGAGRTLYVFDKDTTGTIACTGTCAGLWPPLRVTSGTPSGDAGITAPLATVSRPDGGQQVTLAGRPLYIYAGDTGPGDVNGDGFMGIWHAAKPAGVPLGGSSGAGASATTSTSAGYKY
jgi:predicted lipoprotein with Yx(FWY)xxD motif